jgi:hypothetical protein
LRRAIAIAFAIVISVISKRILGMRLYTENLYEIWRLMVYGNTRVQEGFIPSVPVSGGAFPVGAIRPAPPANIPTDALDLLSIDNAKEWARQHKPHLDCSYAHDSLVGGDPPPKPQAQRRLKPKPLTNFGPAWRTRRANERKTVEKRAAEERAEAFEAGRRAAEQEADARADEKMARAREEWKAEAEDRVAPALGTEGLVQTVAEAPEIQPAATQQPAKKAKAVAKPRAKRAAT